MKNKSVFAFIYFFILIVLMLFVIRLSAHTEIDDISSEIGCDTNLIEKNDILWVIPLFNNVSIVNNSTWCATILNLNKTLGMHGVYHTYREFETQRDDLYLQEGINAFESCLGFKPILFKAPQLAFNKSNRNLIEQKGMEIKGKWNQLTHKVYHCSDTGKFSNKLIDVF